MFEKMPISDNNSENLEENKIEKDISLEKIKIIENMPLDPNKKVELLLVASGDKSATEIELFSDTWIKQDGESPKSVDEDKIKEIRKALDNIGFVSKIHEPEIDEVMAVEDDNIPIEKIKPEDEIRNEREKILITISKNGEIRNELEKAIKEGLDDKMGEIFGFPKTAVEEYLKGEEGELIFRRDLPEEIKKEDWSYFITFLLSKNNWEKEIETPKQWAETIKNNSPKLFDKYIKYKKKEVNF